MGILPTFAAVGSLRTWLKTKLVPASTTHYVDEYFDQERIAREKVYTPAILLAFLAVMRLLDFPFRLFKRIAKARSHIGLID